MPEVHAFSTIPAKILLPIDFSPSSHEALEQATVLAQHFHAEIYLVHVVPESASAEDSKKEKENLALSVAGLAAKGVKASSSAGRGGSQATLSRAQAPWTRAAYCEHPRADAQRLIRLLLHEPSTDYDCRT